MINFSPELIIESTQLCDKKCKGCYASNLVSTKSSLEIQKSQPDFFLDISKLEECILGLSLKNKIKISVRGGEPSLHPQIAELLKCAVLYSSELYLETHGNWIINSRKSEQYTNLIQAISKTKTIVKISFDSMHGTNQNSIREIISSLYQSNISYKVAITEYTLEEFLIQRKLVDWIDDSNIIYQKKALTHEELVKPIYGVIKTNGELSKTLNSKFSKNSYQEISA